MTIPSARIATREGRFSPPPVGEDLVPQWRLALAGLCAALLVGLLRILAVLPRPTFVDGDLAATEIGVLHATRLEQLVGSYSHLRFNEPGPLLYYWLAPFYALTGHNSRALFLGQYVAGVLSALIVVLTVRRTLGRAAGIWACAAVSIYWICLGPTLVPEVWPPSIIALPLLAVLVLAAGAAAGHLRLVLPIGLLTTFLVQSYLSVIPTLALVFGASAALWWASRGDLSRGNNGPERSPRWRWLTIGTIALMALAWVPPAIALATNSQGNARLILHYFMTSHPGLGSHPSITQAMLYVVNDATVVPFGRIAPDNPTAFVIPRVAVCLAALAAAALASVVGRRRRLLMARNLGVVSLVAFAGAVLSLLRVQGFVASFLLFWAGTILLPGVLGAVSLLPTPALAAADSGHRPARHTRRDDLVVLLALLPMVILGAVFLLSPPMPEEANHPGRIMALMRPFSGDLRGHRVRLVTVDVGADPVAEGIGLQVLKSGAELHVSQGWAEKYGPPEARSGGEDIEITVALAVRYGPRFSPPGAEDLGVVGPVEVWVRRLARPDQVSTPAIIGSHPVFWRGVAGISADRTCAAAGCGDPARRGRIGLFQPRPR